MSNDWIKRIVDAKRQGGEYEKRQAEELQAQAQAIAWIGQQVQGQAALLAYIDVFWILTLISLAAVPLALLLRKIKLGGAVAAGH